MTFDFDTFMRAFLFFGILGGLLFLAGRDDSDLPAPRQSDHV